MTATGAWEKLIKTVVSHKKNRKLCARLDE